MSALADLHLSVAAEGILKAATRVGHYMPRTKESMKLCQWLRARDLLEESDNLPGSFSLTTKGENAVSELEAHATA